MAILCYHAVEDGWISPMAVDTASFEEQARWLATRRTVLPLAEAVAWQDRSGRLPRGASAVTFDDGFVSVLDNALPVLAKYQLPATVFLVAETLTPAGRVVDWVNNPPATPLRTLSLDEVLALQDAGVGIGSHSYSHHDLTQLSYAECVTDLSRSRRLLEDLLERPVPFLAYPRGRHDERVRRAARQAGYTHAFALPESTEQVDAFAVPRVGVHRGNSLATVRLKSTRAYLPVRTSVAFPPAARAARAGLRRIRPAGPGPRSDH